MWWLALGLALEPIAHKGGVTVIEVAPNQKQVASGGWDSAIRIWNLDDGKPGWAKRIETANQVTGLSYSPDGTILASSWADGQLRLFRADNGQLIRTIPGGTSFLSGVKFARDGKTLFVSGYDNRVKQFSLTGTRMAVYQGLRSDAYCFDLVGSRIVAGGPGVMATWNVGQPAKPVTNLSFTGSIGEVSMQPDGKRYAAVTLGMAVEVYDFAAKTPVWGVRENGIWTARFSPKGDKLAIGYESGQVTIVHYGGAADVEWRYSGHTETVEALAWTRNQERVLTGGFDGRLIAWDTLEGQKMREFGR